MPHWGGVQCMTLPTRSPLMLPLAFLSHPPCSSSHSLVYDNPGVLYPDLVHTAGGAGAGGWYPQQPHFQMQQPQQQQRLFQPQPQQQQQLLRSPLAVMPPPPASPPAATYAEY